MHRKLDAVILTSRELKVFAGVCPELRDDNPFS
jgi:hypothetical protein